MEILSYDIFLGFVMCFVIGICFVGGFVALLAVRHLCVRLWAGSVSKTGFHIDHGRVRVLRPQHAGARGMEVLICARAWGGLARLYWANICQWVGKMCYIIRVINPAGGRAHCHKQAHTRAHRQAGRI